MPSFESPVALWMVVAIVAGIIEVSIPHFGVIFVSLGAVAAAAVAGLGFGIGIQLLIFMIVLGASLAILRPRLVGSTASPGVPSRTAALAGREGVVTQDVDPTRGAGRVNVGGEDWAARCKTPLPAGTHIRVVGADGIVLEVTPV